MQETDKTQVAEDLKERHRLPTTEDSNMQEIYKKAFRMADVDSTLLIVGETGTGKDFLAKVIHELRRRRRDGEFVHINCGAIPEHLIESELFGYEKGAFTGANPEGRKGLLEAAGEGTVCLDEIGDMPYLLQVKLLNVLNERQFYRVGGSRMIDFKARVIATTNANLGQLVKEKRFRNDLYFRLNVFRINIPPLRRRPTDIMLLLNEFLDYFSTVHGRNINLSMEALKVLQKYRWPGNVRELKSFVEKLVVLSGSAYLEADAVSNILSAGMLETERLQNLRDSVIQPTFSPSDGKEPAIGNMSLREAMDNYEKSVLQRAISSNRTLGDAAAALDIDLSTLMRKKRKYSLECRKA